MPKALSNNVRDPERQKQLSYERDRRNAYGENSKASRKNIPLRKALVNRANRRNAQLALTGLVGAVTEDDSNGIERRLNGVVPKSWAKVADLPLSEMVRRKLERRRRAQARA